MRGANGRDAGRPMAPSERPWTRATLIWQHFWVNHNPSAAFGENECCWQEAAVDISAQSPAEPLGEVRRRGTLWFRVAQPNEGPCSGMTVTHWLLCLVARKGHLLREQTPKIMGAN